MTLDASRAVRQRIQDIPTYETPTLYGDGASTVFKFPGMNITSASAYVGLGTPSPTAWSATGASINVSGYVEFSSIISANSAFQMRYVQSVFSDEIIGEYVTAEGGLNGAALRCAYDLQFDALKRASWRGSDGATFDDTEARHTIKDIIDALRHEIEEDAMYGGSMASWAETQGDYP